MGKSKTKSKSSTSARDKRVARARAARDARREVVMERETQRRIDELFSEDVPAQHSAERILQRLDGGPVPAGMSRFFVLGSSAQRARSVAAEVAALAPASATALTLAADVALHLDGDAHAASVLVDRLLQSDESGIDPATLASHLLAVGRVSEALELVEKIVIDEPEDEDAQWVRAAALALAYTRAHPTGDEDEPAPGKCPCWSGRLWVDCCAPDERRALDRFDDREALYVLRRAVRRFTAIDGRAAKAVSDAVDGWMRDAGAGVDLRMREALVELATEHAWIVGGDDTEDDAPVDLDAPLALFAEHRSTAPEQAAMARRWLEHCEYGLWQVADDAPAPGVWLTEIVSGRRRYAAVDGEQLRDTARWTVLLGALVAIDGTWRTTGAVVPLRPSEADAVAEVAEEMMHAVVAAMSGKRIPPRGRAKSTPEPYGVLVSDTEPAAPEVADLLGKVIGSGLPQLVSMILATRDAAPRLVNTDGDRLCLVKATVTLGDPARAVRALSDHPDIALDGASLTWWGRELDDLEREMSLAELRAQDEDVELADPATPARWLRGTIACTDAGLEVEVNSKERLDRLLELLRELGEEPVVSAKLVIDPEQDLPQLRAGSMIPFAASSDANAAWISHWPDQRLPALGGLSPRAAASRRADQPRLEALLRELEHDADLLAGLGRSVPDLARLRKELRMPGDVWR